MDILRLILIGMCLGIANVIPGVSGGTIAVVFNIYDKLINSITLNVKKLWANKRFLISLFCGMALGILLFSKLITLLYGKFPVQTNWFFTGLILGSLPLLFGLMTEKKDGEEKISPAKLAAIFLCIAAGIAAVLIFADLQETVSKPQEVTKELPALTAGLIGLMFLAGFIGAVAMVIPGISGSLILLIMGAYQLIMASISSLFDPALCVQAFCILAPGGLGVLAGLLAGARLVSLLLKYAPNFTYAVIFGLICGSAITLFPGIPMGTGITAVICCVICLFAGIALAYFSSKLSPEEE